MARPPIHSDMRPAELKNLFAEFLRLDRYVRWEETAKDTVRICGGALANMLSLESKIKTKIDMQGTPYADIKAAEKVLDGIVGALKIAKADMDYTKGAIDRLKKQVAESEANRQRIKDHDKIMDDLSDRQIEADKQHHEENTHRGAEILDLRKQELNLKEQATMDVLETM